MALSLIGYLDHSPDCEHGSRMGFAGLILWTLLILYLFMGLYVLCDIYFLPVLLNISKRLNMSEDVAGATLMAAGSSAPELFTAIIGVFFYAKENPGPSTNCASAAFNMCIIIACSIFFTGFQGLPIRGYPFVRDCLFYALCVIELYLFWEVISPAQISWVESLMLVFTWCGYIGVLAYNNRVIKSCVALMNWMGMTNAEEMLYEQLKSNMNAKQAVSTLSDYSDDDNANSSQVAISYQKSVPMPTIKAHDKDDANDLTADSDDYVDEDEEECVVTADSEESGDHVEHGDHSRHLIAMEMEEADAQQLNADVNRKPHSLRILKQAPLNGHNGATAVRIANPTARHGQNRGARGGGAGGGGGNTEHHADHVASNNKCVAYLHKSLAPFHFAFKYTLPKTNRDSSTPMLSLVFFLVLVWLAILTFICVDAAEKMGNCLGINKDVMGLTILAIGSSLPDCFSSMLAAKQGKGGMAVSNALGSNVFDICICIGLSFLLKSMVAGKSFIAVEPDEGFELFIAALFVLLALFMVAMFCYGLVLNKTIGGGLVVAYIVFVGAFCYILQKE
mmetsp:Transcript_41551/g.68377  ORF Transcript_41551/g.68377 Transcript_41551/m.68377 type:complete len:563 (-) Transcript_41551:6-1694(-)